MTELYTATKILAMACKSVLRMGFVVVLIHPWSEVSAQEAPNLQQHLQDHVSGDSPSRRGQDKKQVKIWDGSASDFFGKNVQRELCDVISRRNHERFEHLFASEKVDVNKLGNGGMTILYWAYLEGNVHAFHRLLELGASPDIPLDIELRLKHVGTRTKGQSVLVHAWRNSQIRPEFFSSAIEYTKKPNQRDRAGRTAAHYCVSFVATRSRLNLLTRIIATGVDLDAKTKAGETACHLAVKHNPDALLLLLWAGADPDIPLPDGRQLIDVVRSKTVDPQENPLSAHYQVVMYWLRTLKTAPIAVRR